MRMHGIPADADRPRRLLYTVARQQPMQTPAAAAAEDCRTGNGI